MNNVNLVVNGTDTLATGVESTNLFDSYGQKYRIAINLNEADVVGGDFRELNEHLRRLIGSTSEWACVEFPSGRYYQRRYLFRDSNVRLEDVDLKPSTPSGVAALVGEDPYTTPGDINFLLKGDRFRAEKMLPGGRKQVAYGTAAMDGNAISPTHGWLIAEAEGDQRTADAKRRAYDNTEGGYINVHWDHREPGDYDPSVPYDQRTGQEYKPQGKHWPNEGLNLRDGWQIWVLPEVAARKAKALVEHTKAVSKSRAEKKISEAQNQIKEAQAALARAEAELARLSRN